MQFNSLYYKRNEQWIPLPQWGQFFLDLGYAVGIQENSENRTVTALALPIKDYSASLITTGVIAGRLSYQNSGNEAIKRFHELLTLASGTTVYYRREGGERVKVNFVGPTSDGLMIELHSGTLTYKIPPKLALRIEFPSKELNSLFGRSHRQSSTAISPFLSYFFNEAAAKEIMTRSCLDCIIIGSIGGIDQEINYTRFGVKNSHGEFLEGTLQDILRIRKFSAHAETYRSDILYTHSKEQQRNELEIPEVIVFDGAKSYLKWSTYWNYPHCIVLLAQSEPEFDEAVQVFNENFIKHHLDDVIFKTPLKISKGVPISVYQEKRK